MYQELKSDFPHSVSSYSIGEPEFLLTLLPTCRLWLLQFSGSPHLPGASAKDQYSELAVMIATACQIHGCIDPRIPGLGMYCAVLGSQTVRAGFLAVTCRSYWKWPMHPKSSVKAV